MGRMCAEMIIGARDVVGEAKTTTSFCSDSPCASRVLNVKAGVAPQYFGIQ